MATLPPPFLLRHPPSRQTSWRTKGPLALGVLSRPEPAPYGLGGDSLSAASSHGAQDGLASPSPHEYRYCRARPTRRPAAAVPVPRDSLAVLHGASQRAASSQSSSSSSRAGHATSGHDKAGTPSAGHVARAMACPKLTRRFCPSLRHGPRTRPGARLLSPCALPRRPKRPAAASLGLLRWAFFAGPSPGPRTAWLAVRGHAARAACKMKELVRAHGRRNPLLHAAAQHQGADRERQTKQLGPRAEGAVAAALPLPASAGPCWPRVPASEAARRSRAYATRVAAFRRGVASVRVRTRARPVSGARANSSLASGASCVVLLKILYLFVLVRAQPRTRAVDQTPHCHRPTAPPRATVASSSSSVSSPSPRPGQSDGSFWHRHVARRGGDDLQPSQTWHHPPALAPVDKVSSSLPACPPCSLDWLQ